MPNFLIGGTLWLDTDQLEKADYMEVYLNEDGEGFAPALWNYRLIPKPSETAQIRSNSHFRAPDSRKLPARADFYLFGREPNACVRIYRRRTKRR